jgi:hypothetical protein
MRFVVKRVLTFSAAVMLAAAVAAGGQDRQESPAEAAPTDPRVGLKSGFRDAGEAVQNRSWSWRFPSGGFLRPQSARASPPPEEEKKEEKEREERRRRRRRRIPRRRKQRGRAS